MSGLLEEKGEELAFEILEEYSGSLPSSVSVIGKALEVIMAICLKAAVASNPELDIEDMKKEFLKEVSENIDKEMGNVHARVVDSSSPPSTGTLQ